MTDIFYVKRGKRYMPIRVWDSHFMDALPIGNHLVTVEKNGKCSNFNVNPKTVPLLAASKICREKIIEALAEAQEYKPSRKPLTPTQRELWQKLANSFAEGEVHMLRESNAAVADKVTDVLIEEAEKLLDNPSVRKAWENFELICKLTAEEK